MSFNVIEGLDATGKSTVVDGLGQMGYMVYKTPPDGMDRYRDGFDDVNARFIYYLSSVLVVGNQIKETGGVCDRYLLTTVVAHEVMGTDKDIIDALMPVMRNAPKPKRTILLTADEDVRMKRLILRGASKNDIANMRINTRLLNGYWKWAKILEHPIVEVDTSQLTPEQVADRVRGLI
jgi:thymidylate kinase